MFRKMTFGKKDKNNKTATLLSQALTSRDKSNTNTGNINQPYNVGGGSNNEVSTSEGTNSLINGGMRLYGGLKNSGLFSKGGGESVAVPEQYQFLSNSSFGSTPSDGTLFGGYNLGGAGAGSGALQTSEMPTFNGFGSGASTAGSGGFGGGVPWAMIANMGKGLYNNISDKTPEDYSDTEQAIIYPIQGAANGSMFGPWGALGGLLYGLGYAFKDDIGLKDSNFFTQMTFPIGMGDGGGLRINGRPVLDIL